MLMLIFTLSPLAFILCTRLPVKVVFQDKAKDLYRRHWPDDESLDDWIIFFLCLEITRPSLGGVSDFSAILIAQWTNLIFELIRTWLGQGMVVFAQGFDNSIITKKTWYLVRHLYSFRRTCKLDDKTATTKTATSFADFM